MTSHVTVAAAGLDARFMVKYREADEFAVAAQQQLAQSQQRPLTAPISAADELVKLGALQQQGILTDQEFAATKARLLR